MNGQDDISSIPVAEIDLPVPLKIPGTSPPLPFLILLISLSTMFLICFSIVRTCFI